MNSYKEYIDRKNAEYGIKFNAIDLAKKFIPYYENQERIKVKFSSGDIKSGRVGVTTGWKPVFILMLTSRSHGSSWILRDNDMVL